MDFIKEHKNLLVICGVVLLCFACYLWGRADIPDNRNPADDARAELDSARGEQQRAYDATQRVGERLDSGIERVGDIESAISGSAESAQHIEAGIDASTERVRDGIAITQDSQRRISESLGVIQEIRAGTRAD